MSFRYMARMLGELEKTEWISSEKVRISRNERTQKIWLSLPVIENEQVEERILIPYNGIAEVTLIPGEVPKRRTFFSQKKKEVEPTLDFVTEQLINLCKEDPVFRSRSYVMFEDDPERIAGYNLFCLSWGGAPSFLNKGIFVQKRDQKAVVFEEGIGSQFLKAHEKRYTRYPQPVKPVEPIELRT